MAVTSRAVVEFVLLGPTHDRRQLQDSPILGDVWAEFASKPNAAVDLLISPNKTEPAGPVATALARRLRDLKMPPHPPGQEAHVAYLQAIVAARLFFDELLRVVVPMTMWWQDRGVRKHIESYGTKDVERIIKTIIEWARIVEGTERDRLSVKFAQFTAIDRYVGLAGVILWASKMPQADTKGVGGLLEQLEDPDDVVDPLVELFKKIVKDKAIETPLVWQVSLNRKAMLALERSVPAVKGDAARALFKVNCSEIRWAVLDSGIDSAHPAFEDASGKGRIEKSYDFSHIREVVSLDNLSLSDKQVRERARTLLAEKKPTEKQVADAVKALRALASDAENDRSIDWSVVAKFVELNKPVDPFGSHGTHVAG